MKMEKVNIHIALEGNTMEEEWNEIKTAMTNTTR